MTDTFFVSGDGVRLRARMSEVPSPKAHVLLLQGRTEFLEKYDELIQRFNEEGYSVLSFDWRGQGLSGPDADTAFVLPDGSKRGHINDFTEYDQDFDAGLNWFDATLPFHEGVPRLLVAHSMGAMIAMRGLVRHPARFDAALLSAPMWGLPIPLSLRVAIPIVAAWKRLVGRLHDFVPGRGPYRREDDPFECNKLTSDLERYTRYQDAVAADPRLGAGGPTMSWLVAALAAIRILPDLVRRAPPDLPIEILSCGDDQIVDTEADRRIAALLPNATVTVLKGSRHEPFMERDEIRDLALERLIRLVR